MERRDNLEVAVAATGGTLVVVAVSEALSAGGPVLRMLPLFVYFAYAAVHDPERDGLDRRRNWLGLVGLVTGAALAWLVV